MKISFKKNGLLAVMLILVLSIGCKKKDKVATTPTPVPPSEVPVTPPPTTPLPTVISSVDDVISGKINKGDELFLYGYLTRQKNIDDDEWYFTDDDGTTELILDFPTSQVPGINKNMLVYGAVDDIGEVDVISWQETDTEPTTPTPPVFPPAGVTPPPLVITSVADINNDVKFGEIIIAGHLTTNNTSDCDEQDFTDGTGTLEVEFQGCGNLPAVGQAIYIYGKTDGRYEVDVFSWMPQ